MTNNKHWIKRVCVAWFSSIFSRASTVYTWGGSTGEAFVQSLSEREQVLEIVAEEAKGKIKLIAHVGCVSTAESQQLAASAKRYGFDAVSAVTPFYYPFSFEEHCDHYRAIIDSADGLPMVVYNIPALSGVKLTLDQINTLVTLPGVGALKTDLWRSLSDGADPS
ncbi:N-acetylneuraminate lyase [Escherichia coli]|uniref:N-acetylneuraminate lyase n=1 Tax=Escherichia coli TaxID=562 RepID=A0A376VDS0_ECOLX|nr:N-acetylneuraminate lyase [Escherichia coli]